MYDDGYDDDGYDDDGYDGDDVDDDNDDNDWSFFRFDWMVHGWTDR